MDIKYPEIEVRLVGEDGNAFAIIARVASALRGHGCDRDTVAKFRSEATSGDYDNLLRTCFAWVNCDTDYDEDDENEDEEDTCGWCDEPHSECECVDL
jgi:hypothetical protein